MTIDNIQKVIPLGQRVVVKTVKIEETTEGGILLPEDHRRREQDSITEGILIDYGPTAFLDMITDVNPKLPAKGSKAYFVKYAGTEITVNEETYRLVNDEDIFAIINGDDICQKVK